MVRKKLEFLTRKMYNEAFNTGKLSLLDEYYANDLVCHRPPYPVIKDLLAFKEWIGDFRHAFPDLIYTIHEIIVQEEVVAARLTYAGTHTEVLAGTITPTNKNVSGPGCIFWHWQNGKICEEWEYWDELGFWEQLGYTHTSPNEACE
jgi:steroid delta-isomerase-like uncharacterized protein